MGDAVQRFASDGWIGPLPVHPGAAMAASARALQRIVDGDPSRAARTNRHLDLDWVLEIASQPQQLAIVGELLDDDPVLWASEAWVRIAGTSYFTPWHQDAPFFPPAAAGSVTAWVALSRSDESNGGLCMASGTHLQAFEHVPNTDGRTDFDARLDDSDVAELVATCPTLEPGDVLLFHAALAHTAAPNHGVADRLAMSFRYVPAAGSPGWSPVWSQRHPGRVPVIAGWRAEPPSSPPPSTTATADRDRTPPSPRAGHCDAR